MTRIIAGEWRGHSLPHLKEGSVRPTTDRARTILFDTLRDVFELRVLDLYSGTGALGFEALSRGAKSLTSIDRDRRYIRKQVEWISLHPKPFKGYAGDVEKKLHQLHETFDLIFADPPYVEGISCAVTKLIAAHAAPGARFVYETSRRNITELNSPVFILEKEKIVAETKIQIYKVEEV